MIAKLEIITTRSECRQRKTDHASIQSIADSLFFSSSKMESFENIVEGIMALGRKPEFPDLMGEKLCWSVDPVNVPGPPDVVSNVQSHSSLSSALQIAVPPPRFPSVRSEMSEGGNSFVEDHATDALRPHISHGLLLASQTSTPRLTPPGSPPSPSASVSPI
ncbi:hypothetical protein SO802_027408 [Lithocarpus litseifolius]|uniref:Uncharacterized protein n=1 Tax=Lithocarpus litseifolius TaxID=425828 RepID=A0AAW2C3A4_9ROSI